ncbi:MAG: tRNA (guanine6-N2)-methyltransferase [Myxococcota bacterium]
MDVGYGEEPDGLPCVRLQLTTNPGFEDLALDELRIRAEAAGRSVLSHTLRPFGLAGHLSVYLAATWEPLRPVLLELRSVHRVIRVLDQFPLHPDDPLGDIRRRVAAHANTIPELAPEHVSFRVTSSRTGTHGFTSEEVARDAGAGVRDVLPRAVSLKAFDVEIRCDVRDRVVVLGVQQRRLAHRSHGPYSQRTSLRANVAWCLLQLARPDAPPTVLLDPCCGAGTILVEAGRRWPEVQLRGGDRLERATEGTAGNLAAAGLLDRAVLHTADARTPGAHGPPGTVDTVVVNPPFGKRLGRTLNLEVFYRALLLAASQVATADARMVVVVQRRGAFNRALGADVGWRIHHVRVVELGGLYVGVFVLERG